MTEDVDNGAPRIMHAAVKSKAHDKADFHELDLPSYSATLKAHASNVLPEEMRTRTMGKSLSATRMGMKPLSDPKNPITYLEDESFTYYVPGIYSKKGKDALLKNYDLLKLEKKMKVNPAHPGEGTGFRCQGGGTNWWPVLDSDPEISQIQRTYRRPPFHRSVSATALHGF